LLSINDENCTEVQETSSYTPPALSPQQGVSLKQSAEEILSGIKKEVEVQYLIPVTKKSPKDSGMQLSNYIEQVLLEKLIVTQLVKKLPTYYGMLRFITVSTRAHCWFLSSARCIHSTPSHPIFLRSILILSSHLGLGLPHGLFHSGFWTRILYAFLISHMCYMTHPSHPRFDHPDSIW
jgi:hypothetical protein